jgi:mannose-6-phosphate isomerase
LVEDAYPLWANLGIDANRGGFVEALAPNAAPLAIPRRLRVQPRQIYAFACAPALWWEGKALEIVANGLDYLERCYRKADGLFRTLIAADGTPLDESALLYDHAFLLLGFAAAARALDDRARLEQRALELRRLIERRWHLQSGGFLSGDAAPNLRESNPHMHMLEACLAWSEIGSDLGWRGWVEEIADIAVSRLVDSASGTIRETYDAAWDIAPGLAGRIIDPGHQFEWAWLLMRCRCRNAAVYRSAALRLLHVGESRGTRDGVVLNAILDDGSVHNANARLWPQTERLKATLLAHEVTGESRFALAAVEAATNLLCYLETDIAGLWHDERLSNGCFPAGPSPASTFYHLIGAIDALAFYRRSAKTLQ